MASSTAARIPHADTQSKQVSILGATGSIGDSTLNVISQHKQRFSIAALTAQDNVEKLIHLAHRYRPALVAIGNSDHYTALKNALSGTGIHCAAGREALNEAAALTTDLTVCAMVGAAGLMPAMTAITHGKTVAVANKETLVCAGELVMTACKKHGTTLLPVDSEHNAIFQVFAEQHRDTVESITLTASGGPFRTRALNTFHAITPQEAMHHPRWNMGAKISVDSATMMNKCLELIEAHYLFSIPEEKLNVLMHPESIVHSLVHYEDGSVLAQLGMPDMRIPIAYALSWPQRMVMDTPRLNLADIGTLHFETPDDIRFPALALGRTALRTGTASRIALNAANEIAVARFLKQEIAFTDITRIVARVMEATDTTPIHTLDDVIEADQTARARAAAA